MIVIHLARKPPNGTVAGNAVRFGTGGLDIARTRIGTFQNTTPSGMDRLNQRLFEQGYRPDPYQQGEVAPEEGELGRWPANLVIEHQAPCRVAGSMSVRGSGKWPPFRGVGSQVSGMSGHSGQDGLVARVAEESVDRWVCAQGCPAKDLDKQSGITTSAVAKEVKVSHVVGQFVQNATSIPGQNQHGDSGGASRFFKQVQEEPDFFRAAGDVPCSTCSRPYSSHPLDGARPDLNVLCNGDRVKL